MTPARAAVYLGTGVLLLAWLSSAAGVGEQSSPPPETPQPIQTSGTETLASDVQAQAARLRERIAPVPQQPLRNPFAFASTPEPARARVAKAPGDTAAAAPSPVVYPEPTLALIGVAEDGAPAGKVRTAIITADGGEVFLVRVGDPIGARYKVQTIGADAVELTDLVTGSLRRLALR